MEAVNFISHVMDAVNFIFHVGLGIFFISHEFKNFTFPERNIEMANSLVEEGNPEAFRGWNKSQAKYFLFSVFYFAWIILGCIFSSYWIWFLLLLIQTLIFGKINSNKIWVNKLDSAISLIIIAYIVVICNNSLYGC